MLAPLGAQADDPGCEESEPGIMAASIAHAMPAAKMGTTSFLCATMAKLREAGRGAHNARLAMLSRRWRARKFSILSLQLHHGPLGGINSSSTHQFESVRATQLITLNQCWGCNSCP